MKSVLNAARILPWVILAALLTTARAQTNNAAQTPGPAQSSGTNLSDLSLDQLINVVFAASRHEETLAQAPASVTIITHDDIVKYGYHTVEEALASVPGFYITDSHDVTPNYGVRGFGIPFHVNTRILFLMNGLPVEDNYWSGFMSQLLPDIQQGIDRIEVIQGPGSAVFGDDAIEGVVNIITRTGSQVDGVEVTGEGNSDPGGRAVVTAGKQLTNGWDVFTTAHFDQDNGQSLPLGSLGDIDHIDAHHEDSLFLSATHDEITAHLWYAHDNRIIPTGAFGANPGDDANRSIHWWYLGDLQWQHELDETKSFSWRVYGQSAPVQANLAYGPDLLNNYDGDTWAGSEFQFNWQPVERNLLIVGALYEYHFTYFRGNMTDPGGDVVATQPGGRHYFPYWATYAQDDFHVLSNLTLTTGLRLDALPATENYDVSPRVALVWNTTPTTTTKLLLGQAFRAPDESQLTFPPDAGYGETAASIKSEKITTGEFVLEQAFKNGWSAQTSVFRNDINGVIDAIPDTPVLVYSNLYNVYSTGVEAEVKKKFDNGVSGFVNGTWQNSDFSAGIPINSPDWIANIGVIWPIFGEKLTAGVRENYLSSRATSVPGQHTSDSYETDLTLSSHEWLRHWTVELSAKDLFNTENEVPANVGDLLSEVPSLGRTIIGRATYRF